MNYIKCSLRNSLGDDSIYEAENIGTNLDKLLLKNQLLSQQMKGKCKKREENILIDKNIPKLTT
jgi:hypothetical protein